MTRYVGVAIFEDSTRLYLLYDGTMDTAMRPLFPTEKAVKDWDEAGTPARNAPDEGEASDEAVTVMPNVALGAVGSFASRASKKSMQLTGPRSFLEMVYENGATACRDF